MHKLFVLFTLLFALISIAEERRTGGPHGAGAANGGSGTDMDHGSLNWGAPYKPCKASDSKVTSVQMKAIAPMLATRKNRLKHVLWHYGSGGLDPSLGRQIGTAFGDGWSSPNPECPPPKLDTTDSQYNPVGENFFFMHRAMRNAVNDELRRKGLKCIGGWTVIPGKDSKWPVPGGSSQGGAKTDSALSFMKEWERMFNNPAWLKAHSLSQLGQLVEVTIHNNMHMRWADELKGNIDTNFPIEKKFLTDDKYPPNWKADAVSNDYLGNPYSAHVNPHFWKLHGLVDGLIDKWATANGYAEVAVDCAGRTGCYQWHGTWTGGDLSKPATRGAGTATLSMKVEDKGLETTTPQIQKLAKERSKDFFKHTFSPEIEKEFQAIPKAATRALRLEGAGTTPEQEYQENKARWDQMEKQMLARMCPARR